MSAEETHEDRFVARMRRIRKLRGISQMAIAEATGIPRSVVAKMEIRRRNGISLSEAAAISAALGVDLAEMLSADPMKIRTEIAVD